MTVSSLKPPITCLIGYSHRPNTLSRSKTHRSQFQVGVFAGSAADTATIEDLVRNTPLFADLTLEEQGVINAWLRPRHYKSDDTLFVKDSPSDTLYLIQNGWVKLNADNQSVVPPHVWPR